MPCKPVLPTGEKQAQRFEPPQFWPVNKPADLQRALQRAMADIKADLAGVHAAITEPPQVTRRNSTPGVVDATAGSVVRVTPPAAGITVLLPAARLANKGKDVAVLVEGSGGPVTVRAAGGTVNGQASVVLNGVGLRVFRSDGGEGGNTGGWWIVGQSSASPGSVAIGAGTNTTNQGTVVFANANNVTFGMNTAGVVTATATVASTADSIRFSAGTTNFIGSNWSFSNTPLLQWGLTGSSLTATPLFQIQGRDTALNATSVNATVLKIDPDNFVSWSYQTAGTQFILAPRYNGIKTIAAGTTSLVLSNSAVTGAQLSFVDSNNMSWGLNGSTITGQPFKLISHVGGNSVNATRIAFSDASNVTWSISTAASAATIFASVAAGGGGGITNIRLSAGTTSNLASAFTFADANNVSFGLNAGTITATVTVASSLTNIRLSAGTTSNLASAFTFSNSNNFSWGLNAGTITAQPFGFVSLVGAGVTNNVTRWAFENASNVTWSLVTAASAVTVMASVAAGGGGGITAVNISAGTSNTNVSNFSFADSNNFSWGLNGSTITARPHLHLSVVGADSVNATRLAFSTNTGADAVNWIVSTAVSAMTVRATIDVGLKVVSAPGGAISSGTLEFTNGNGVTWTRNGQSIGASVAAGGGGEATISHYKNYFVEQDFGGASSATAGQMHLFPLHPFYEGFPGRMTASTLNVRVQQAVTNGSASYAWTIRAGIYTLANSTQLSLLNSASSTFSATTQSSATRNNLISGVRDISFHSSQWSAQPVFSQGIQYWMLLGTSTAGSSYPNAMLVNMDRQIAPRGPWGSSQTLGVHDSPFWGAVSTTALPASIGTAGLVSGAGIALRYAGCMQQINMGNLRASLP